MAQLQQRIAELERAGKRQATPFARRERQAGPKRPGRKAGQGRFSEILDRWGSFPRFLGDVVASTVVTIPGDLFGGLEGTQVIEKSFLCGCQLTGVDVMFTDGNGNPQPQDVNRHQGGRVAYTHLQPINIRLEIIQSNLGTDNGRVTVRWSRDLPTATFSFRLFYRLLNCPPPGIFVIPDGCLSCGDGTPEKPYGDLLRAILAARGGEYIYLSPGSYPGWITITKNVTLAKWPCRDGIVQIGR